MTKPSFLLLLALLVVFLASAHKLLAENSPPAVSSTKTELEELIDAKKRDLQKIEKEAQTAKKDLDETVNERNGLQTEVHHIDKNIKTIELSIRAGQIENQKLKLEVRAISEEVKDINETLNSKQKTIPEILRAYHEKSETSLLFIFLEKESLSDSFTEVQSLNNLQAQLLADIVEYRESKERLRDTQEEILAKREEIVLKERELSAKQVIVEEEAKNKKILLAETKNRESLYQKIYEGLAKKAMEFETEIERIESALRKNIDLSRLPLPRTDLFQNPVPGAKLTQGYGRTKFAVANYKTQWHNGIDLGDSVGTPVYAAEGGKVVAIGNTDEFCPKRAYGKYAVIKHDNNLTTLYSHFSKYIVKNGQEVKRGELIGYIGRTGWATGPHVHFTVYASDTYKITQSKNCGLLPVGGDINPLDYVSI